MHLLTDVRSFFRRRRLTPATAGANGRSTTTTATADLGREGRTARAAVDAPARPGQTVEAKPAGRSRSEAQRASEELVTLVRRIGTRLEAADRRDEQLAHAASAIPTGMETLTDINRRASVLVETIQDHLSRLTGREEVLDATLGRLADATARQAQATELLRQSVESNTERADRTDDTLASVRTALEDLAGHERRSMEALDRIVASARDRDDRMLGDMKRTGRWLVATVATSATVGVVAVTVALVAMLGA